MSSDHTKDCSVSKLINKGNTSKEKHSQISFNTLENDRLVVILVKRLSRTSGLVSSEDLKGGGHRNFSSTNTGATQS